MTPRVYACLQCTYLSLRGDWKSDLHRPEIGHLNEVMLSASARLLQLTRWSCSCITSPIVTSSSQLATFARANSRRESDLLPATASMMSRYGEISHFKTGGGPTRKQTLLSVVTGYVSESIIGFIHTMKAHGWRFSSHVSFATSENCASRKISLHTTTRVIMPTSHQSQHIHKNPAPDYHTHLCQLQGFKPKSVSLWCC